MTARELAGVMTGFGYHVRIAEVVGEGQQYRCLLVRPLGSELDGEHADIVLEPVGRQGKYR